MPPLPATAGFVLTLGKVICGIGMAAAGFGPSFGAISRQTPPKKRSVALGVVTAGGSIGQFAIVPFASLVQHRLDNWHIKMSILAVVSTAMAPPRSGTARTARGRKPRHNHAAGLQSWAARGVRDAGVLAADGGPLRLHLSRNVHRAAFARLHPRQGGRHVGFGRPASALELGGWAIGLAGMFNLA